MAASPQAINIRPSLGLSLTVLFMGLMYVFAITGAALGMAPKLLLLGVGSYVHYRGWRRQQLWPRGRVLHVFARDDSLWLLNAGASSRRCSISYHSEFLIVLRLESLEREIGLPGSLVLCRDMMSTFAWCSLRRSALQASR